MVMDLVIRTDAFLEKFERQIGLTPVLEFLFLGISYPLKDDKVNDFDRSYGNPPLG